MNTVTTNVLLLDGALGTELERRGFNARLPLWSARALIEAPELVVQIHRDYLEAGAQILTAATFRTSRYALAKEQLQHRAEELTHAAVRLARRAISLAQPEKESPNCAIRMAGSIAPLEDCYLPELAPPDDIMEREFAHTCRTLADAGVDLLLVETQNSRREALTATEAALSTGLPVWLSLMPQNAFRLFNGDSLLDTAQLAVNAGVEAVLVNCCVPSIAEAALIALRKALPGIRLGAYPNFGTPVDGRFSHEMSPRAFADWGSRMANNGATLLGGCCGTTPEHIRALREALGRHANW